MPEFTNTSEFQQLAVAFKRVRNITRDVTPSKRPVSRSQGRRRGRNPRSGRSLEEIHGALADHRSGAQVRQGFSQAFSEASQGSSPVVDKFFVDVLVMADDPQVRRNRRWLLKRLETLMLNLADVSQMVPEERQA